MSLSDQRYIVVEGLPGSGKSALLRSLAKAMGARVVADAARDNPFLAAYFKDPKPNAFPAQVFSLLSRFRQQQELAQGDLFNGGMVAEYLFERDRIYANLILDDRELLLYDQLYRTLGREPIPRPDLAVFLQAATPVLTRRLHYAAQDGRVMSPEALEELGKAYSQFFFQYSASPLLVVNTNDLDLRDQGRDLGDLIARILETHAGTQYYTPKH